MFVFYFSKSFHHLYTWSRVCSHFHHCSVLDIPCSSLGTVSLSRRKCTEVMKSLKSFIETPTPLVDIYPKQRRHQKKKSPKDVPKFCIHCKITFTSYHRYYKHFLKSNCEFESKVCLGCGKDFKTTKKVRRHVKTCQDLVPERVKCDFCNRSYTNMSSMIRHAYGIGKILGKCKKNGQLKHKADCSI